MIMFNLDSASIPSERNTNSANPTVTHIDQIVLAVLVISHVQ